MRVLLDESIPRGVRSLLPGHSVSTVQECGWTSKDDGELLGLASDEFDVIVTADQSFALSTEPGKVRDWRSGSGCPFEPDRVLRPTPSKPRSRNLELFGGREPEGGIRGVTAGKDAEFASRLSKVSDLSAQFSGILAGHDEPVLCRAAGVVTEIEAQLFLDGASGSVGCAGSFDRWR